MAEKRKVRPGHGMPFGVGYFEDVDADEIMDLVEGKVAPTDYAAQDEAQDVETRSGRMAMNSVARVAEDLTDKLGRISTFLSENEGNKALLEALAKSPEAKKFRKAMEGLEPVLTMYGHEILPHLKG